MLRLSARWGGAGHQGVVVNSKKLRRLMREHDLQPKRRRRAAGLDGAVGKAASGAIATAVKRVPSRAPCPASAPAKTPVRACRATNAADWGEHRAAARSR